MWKLIGMGMKVKQQPRPDLRRPPLEDGTPLCLPLRIPRDVLRSKCRGIMVAGGRGERPR